MQISPSEALRAHLGCPLLLLLLLATPIAAAEIRLEDIANDGCRNEPRLRVSFDKYCHRHVRRPPEISCGGGGGSGGGGGMARNSSSGGIVSGTAGNGFGGGVGVGGIGGSFINSASGFATVNSPSIVPPVTPVVPVPGPVIGRGMIWAVACLVLLFLVGRRKHVKHRRTSAA